MTYDEAVEALAVQVERILSGRAWHGETHVSTDEPSEGHWGPWVHVDDEVRLLSRWNTGQGEYACEVDEDGYPVGWGDWVCADDDSRDGHYGDVTTAVLDLGEEEASLLEEWLAKEVAHDASFSLELD